MKLSENSHPVTVSCQEYLPKIFSVLKFTYFKVSGMLATMSQYFGEKNEFYLKSMDFRDKWLENRCTLKILFRKEYFQ